MTVVYSHEVSRGGFGNFFRLLFWWRGSVYRVVLLDLLIYGLIYGAISILYRFVLFEDDKIHFEMLVNHCNEHFKRIPISFVLGFYVAQVVTRWWGQFTAIPWPDKLATLIASSFHGTDERTRMMKRSVLRYVNLTLVLTLMMISPQVKTRFPTLDHLVEAGLLLPHEKTMFETIDQYTDYPKYWIPIIWASNIITRARREERILSDVSYVRILKTILDFRGGCGQLLAYDWICIPLVYTQVVTLAVYLYFLVALFGDQFIDDVLKFDMYVPIFLFFEFFFYMGWLKVAETMLNPFGEDDDDFEVNWLIDRNISISYLVVDQMGNDFPQLMKDIHWDIGVPNGLPYTKSSEKYKTETHKGSTALRDIQTDENENPNTEKEEDQGSNLGSVVSGKSHKSLFTSDANGQKDANHIKTGRDIGINLDSPNLPAEPIFQSNIDGSLQPYADLMEPKFIETTGHSSKEKKNSLSN